MTEEQLGATGHSKSVQLNESTLMRISEDSFQHDANPQNPFCLKIRDRKMVEREVTKLLQTSPVVEAWEVSDVSKWLRATDLADIPKVQEIFSQHQITGARLLELTDVELQQNLKINSLGKRRNILKALTYLKAQIARNLNS